MKYLFFSAPDRMGGLRVEDVGSRYITVGWSAPSTFKGTLKSYIIQYKDITTGKTMNIPDIPVSLNDQTIFISLF